MHEHLALHILLLWLFLLSCQIPQTLTSLFVLTVINSLVVHISVCICPSREFVILCQTHLFSHSASSLLYPRNWSQEYFLLFFSPGATVFHLIGSALALLNCLRYIHPIGFSAWGQNPAIRITHTKLTLK